MYYDRRVTNKEIAERVAVVGAKEIQELCQKFVDPNLVFLRLLYRLMCVYGAIRIRYHFCKKEIIPALKTRKNDISQIYLIQH